MLTDAQQDFGPRSSVIDNGWIADVVGGLPGLDRQVAAVRSLRHAGEDGTSLALDLVPLLRDLHSGAAAGGSGVIKELARSVALKVRCLPAALGDLSALDAA